MLEGNIPIGSIIWRTNHSSTEWGSGAGYWYRGWWTIIQTGKRSFLLKRFGLKPQNYTTLEACKLAAELQDGGVE